MKTKLLLSIVLITSCSILTTAQVPQGFNYQAVARDGAGVVIVDKTFPVKIAIRTLLTGGEILWEEEHPVTTNRAGVISLVVGTGTKTGGTMNLFSLIDWSAQTLYLTTSVKYPGPEWVDMGTTQIWAVPYSLVAKHIEGPIEKLDIAGKTTSMEEALFEVRNKDGQIVFAVYNEGVRVYVDDGDEKGIKGGFAVGGFGTDKAESQEYFTVHRDSTRIYINQNKIKGIKGGFAVGGFGETKEPVVPFLDISPKNYFIGHEAGQKITSGEYNAVIGFQAGKEILDGKYNIFIGHQSGSGTLGPLGVEGGSEGNFNCFIGFQAGMQNKHGANNTFVGYSSGMNNLSDHNTFLGSGSGSGNTTGYSNTFIGTAAGANNNTGGYNVFLGRSAGNNVLDGHLNTFIGNGAGANIRSGQKNIVIGAGAMGENIFAGDGTGSSNIIIGFEAGYSAENSNSSSNIFIGNRAGLRETGSGKLIIENSESETPLIYGSFETDVFRINGKIEATGEIASLSDSLLKDNISELEGVIGKIQSLRGIYFDWDLSEKCGLLLQEGRQIGMIAQEVERVYPELVTVNDRGYKMVDYTKFTPVLLEAVREQQLQIENQQKQIDELKALIMGVKAEGTAQLTDL